MKSLAMKLKWMVFAALFMTCCVISITGLHAVHPGINEMNITNCSTFYGGSSEDQSHVYTTMYELPDVSTIGPDLNATDICIATYVGENITLITKRLTSIKATNPEMHLELLNKSVLRTHVVHVCDSVCEQKFVVGHIYVKSDLREDSGYFMQFYTDFKCTDQVTFAESSSLRHYLNVVALSFMCLSIVACIYYVVKFALDKSLRTLPGSCILSLCIADLILYPCFFAVKISPHDKNNRYVCPVYLYTILANWFWINAITFDLWKTIRLAIVKLRRPTVKSLVIRFIYYSIYSWGTSSVLTFMVVYPFTSDRRLSYSGGFSNQGKSLAELLVAIPLLIVQLSNFAFFYSSYHMVFRGSKSLTEQVEVSIIRNNFRFFFRLSFVTVIMWIVCIVGYFANIEILVYVYLYSKILETPYIVWNYAALGKNKHICIKCPGCHISATDLELSSSKHTVQSH